MQLISDGVIAIRPPVSSDAEALVAGRDTESRRWLGAGDDDPRPAACIVVDGVVVGWVDYDTDREWLEAGEVNIGYNVFPRYRRNGYASRAVELLLSYLAHSTDVQIATLLIATGNEASLGVAEQTDFVAQAKPPLDQNVFFKRAVRPTKP